MSEPDPDLLGLRERWKNETTQVRAQAVAALRRGVAERGVTRVALGISGGLDSAVAASLCVEALGPENVLGVLMPMRATDATSLSLAQGVVNALGLTSRRVNMNPVLEAYFANFPDANRNRRGACLAWLRVGVLLDLASHYGAAVVQALNRGDRLLRYGEGAHELAGALKPLAGLLKSQVVLLGEQGAAPADVLRRRPSLEYWPGQTDEADLGFAYAALDPALAALADLGLAPAEAVARGADRAAVEYASRHLAQATAPAASR